MLKICDESSVNDEICTAHSGRHTQRASWVNHRNRGPDSRTVNSRMRGVGKSETLVILKEKVHLAIVAAVLGNRKQKIPKQNKNKPIFVP